MLKEIETRQSIRKYKDIPVTDAQIIELLQAAMNAPSAKNEQSWRFVVVTNREVLDKIATLSPYMKMMTSASCCILVLADNTVVNAPEYMYYDCSAAIQNMLIQANAMGLGTCWCAIGPSLDRIEAFSQEFKFDSTLTPISAVAVGVSDEDRPLLDRYDESKICYIK